MKRFLPLAFLLISMTASGQLLWTEDFEGEANGSTTGTAGGTIGGTWSVTTTPSGTFSKQNNVIVGNVFRVDNTLTEGVWESDNFSIATTGMATISIDLTTAGTNSTDYIRAYYKADGGPEVLFAELLGQFIDAATTGSAIVSGSNLQIVIRGMDNTTATFFGIPLSLNADNLTVTAVPVVYSRASTAWNVGTTWSATGFTGASCGCTPTVGQVAIIGGGFTVDLTADANVGGVDIQITGTLRYTAANLDLGIEAGLFRVRSGGTLNRNGQSAAQIDYNQDVGGATFQVDAGGTATIEDVTLTANATNLHYFTGGGSLTIADDILIGADGATLTNNMSTTLALTDRIEFSAGTTNSIFVNNGTVTATTLFYGDVDNTITNNSTITAAITVNNVNGNVFTNVSGATANIGTIDLTNGDFTIDNSGTINQSGNFSNVDTGSNGNFNNLSTGVWNWTLTPNTTFDTSMGTVLDCATPGNTFNYSGAGAQRIIPCQYSNLTLSTSGAKDANNANFSVNGNWTVTGTATFTEGTGTVTLNGTTAQSVTTTLAAGETFNNLILNNSLGTSPQITLNDNVAVSSVLTMTEGNVNLNGNTFTISSNTAGALVHGLTGASGWMYGGSIVRTRVASVAFGVGVARSLFPLGSSGDWRPFYAGQSSAAGTAGTMTVSHTNATTTSNVSIADSGPVTIVRRHDAFWTVSTAGISGGTWALRAGGTTFGSIGLIAPADVSNLRMSLAAGVVATHSAAAGTTTEPLVNRTGLTFGQLTNSFYLASIDATDSPLPIQLIGFSAKLNNDIVNLKWSTASELNNDFFTIERTSDIEEFETIGDPIDGNGTTAEKNNYYAQDERPLYGRSYYRLKQTDFDGAFTYSPIEVVDYEGPRFSTLKVYPNPSQGHSLTIEVNGLKDQATVPVQIYNVQGQKVYDHVFEVSTRGTLKHDFEFGSPLRQGLYIIKAGQTLQLTQKIIVD